MVCPLEFRGVGKSFRRKTVLDVLNLQLVPGAVTVLLGRNGVGKSTLLKLAMGLMRPSKGEVFVFGEDPTRKGGRVRDRLGFVPDHFDVDPGMTPRQLGDLTRPFYSRWDGSICTEALERFEVPANQRFGALSKGQATKALLAMALASKPDLMLLDEPFAGLDAVSADEVLRALLHEGVRDRRSLLVTTHDLEIASRIADRVALVENGCVTRHESLQDFDAKGRTAPLPSVLKAALKGEPAAAS